MHSGRTASLDVHQIAHGRANKYRRQQASVEEKHAAHRYHVWSHDEIEQQLVQDVADRQVPSAYLRTWYALADRPTEQRRYAQYVLAYLRGGIYVDVEATVTQPLTAFRAPLVVARANGNALHPSWMIAEQVHHPVLRAALDRYVHYEGKTATPVTRFVERETIEASTSPSVRIVDDWQSYIQAPSLPWYATWRNAQPPIRIETDDGDVVEKPQGGGLMGTIRRAMAAQRERGSLWNVLASVAFVALGVIAALYVAFRHWRPDQMVRNALQRGQAQASRWLQSARNRFLPARSATEVEARDPLNVRVQPPVVAEHGSVG